MVSYTVLHRDDLPYDGNTYEFQGIQYPGYQCLIYLG